jgi:uncharacterized protein (UPF0332 family)
LLQNDNLNNSEWIVTEDRGSTLTPLERAREHLRGAEACWQVTSLEGCALCCYATLFWAAIAALAHIGVKQPEWSHGGLQQRFSLELIKKRHLVAGQFGTYIARAYDLRTKAHYELQEIGRKETERILRRTREFVQKIEEVILR